MHTTNLNAYALLARFYDALLADRLFPQRQFKLIQDLFESRGFPITCKVLDAACGTGALLAELRRGGYCNLAGLDGAPEMLEVARQRPELAGIPLVCQRWEFLGAVFESKSRRFDGIALLGNSLAHAQCRSVDHILSQLLSALEPGGVLLFDIRHWASTPSGELFQPGREIDSPRQLPEFQLGPERWQAEECCTYSGDRQFVTYRLTCVSAPSHGVPIEPITLSYALFDAADAKRWLVYAGFEDVAVMARAEWHNLVLTARRPG